MGIGDWGLGPIPNPQSPEKYLNIYHLIMFYIIFLNKLQN